MSDCITQWIHFRNAVKQPVRLGCLSAVALGLMLNVAVSSIAGSNQFAYAKPPVKAPVKTQPVKPAAQNPTVKPPTGQEEASKPALNKTYESVEVLELVRHADQWLDKPVAFEGTFNTFHNLALDYKGAFRDSKDFLSFLILRPDVGHHEIPLSELKMTYPRKRVNEIMDLQAGDKILVKGTVFSTALGDPWVDVDSITITQAAPKPAAKSPKKK